jgi:hypothetical protein
VVHRHSCLPGGLSTAVGMYPLCEQLQRRSNWDKPGDPGWLDYKYTAENESVDRLSLWKRAKEHA